MTKQEFALQQADRIVTQCVTQLRALAEDTKDALGLLEPDAEESSDYDVAWSAVDHIMDLADAVRQGTKDA